MSKVTKIAVGFTATLGTLLGLATSGVADMTHRPLNMNLPPKSCTWMGAGADHFGQVDSGKTTYDPDSKTTWKCYNGGWTQVGGKPVRDTRPGAR